MTPIDLNIPILTTPRLILRGHKLEDLDAMVAIWNDPIVRRFFHSRPNAREDIWAQLLRHFGCWAALGYGMWAIEDRHTGEYVGTGGVFDVKRGIDPALEDIPEAGWTLASRCHGNGLATEAMQAALSWTDAHLGHRVFCITAPANVASIRVAEKCGFRHWRETIYKEDPTLIFVRESN